MPEVAISKRAKGLIDKLDLAAQQVAFAGSMRPEEAVLVRQEHHLAVKSLQIYIQVLENKP